MPSGTAGDAWSFSPRAVPGLSAQRAGATAQRQLLVVKVLSASMGLGKFSQPLFVSAHL